jgi:antitoxin FitA
VEVPMSDLLIRDLPAAMKADLEQKARQNGRSLSEEAKAQIGRSLAIEDAPPERKYSNAYEAIRSAFVENDALMSDEEHAEFMRAIQDGRRDLGRPPPELE